MPVETTIQLYPAMGGGVQMVNTPQGAVTVPIPFLNYDRVQEWAIGSDNLLRFVTRAGDKIVTNIQYLVKCTTVSEGDA